MRNRLFRGKKINTNEFVFGNLIISGKDFYILENKENCISKNIGVNGFWNINSSCFKVIPETVGQFTDLTDKNGVKIFEGDECKLGDVKSIFNVSFEDGCFVCIDEDVEQQGLLGEIQSIFIEIIGNIHEK